MLPVEEISILLYNPKANGPMCCVMHVKEASALYLKVKGFAPVFLAVDAVCAVAPSKHLLEVAK